MVKTWNVLVIGGIMVLLHITAQEVRARDAPESALEYPLVCKTVDGIRRAAAMIAQNPEQSRAGFFAELRKDPTMNICGIAQVAEFINGEAAGTVSIGGTSFEIRPVDATGSCDPASDTPSCQVSPPYAGFIISKPAGNSI